MTRITIVYPCLFGFCSNGLPALSLWFVVCDLWLWGLAFYGNILLFTSLNYFPSTCYFYFQAIHVIICSFILLTNSSLHLFDSYSSTGIFSGEDIMLNLFNIIWKVSLSSQLRHLHWSIYHFLWYNSVTLFFTLLIICSKIDSKGQGESRCLIPDFIIMGSFVPSDVMNFVVFFSLISFIKCSLAFSRSTRHRILY